MVQTIEQNFGARIDYWAVTSFWGIARMVETVGGLQVRIPFRMQDPLLGLELPSRPQAAPMAPRSSRSPATGTAFPVGTSVARRTAAASCSPRSSSSRRSSGRTRVGSLTWIAAGVRNMDTDLPVDELVDLAFTASGIRFGAVRNVVLPGGTGTIGGRSVVVLSMGTARAIFADAKADAALRPANVPRSPTGAG